MTKNLALLSSFAWLAAACGDNRNPGAPDAMPDAPPAHARAIVVSGDFSNSVGVMSSLDLTTMQVQQRVAPTTAVGSDPMLRKIGNELFVINRSDGNSVTIFD